MMLDIQSEAEYAATMMMAAHLHLEHGASLREIERRFGWSLRRDDWRRGQFDWWVDRLRGKA